MGQTIPAETPIAAPEVATAFEAYLDAAEGDLARALLWALEDLIACEERSAARIATAEALVSRGFIRAALRLPRG